MNDRADETVHESVAIVEDLLDISVEERNYEAGPGEKEVQGKNSQIIET